MTNDPNRDSIYVVTTRCAHSAGETFIFSVYDQAVNLYTNFAEGQLDADDTILYRVDFRQSENAGVWHKLRRHIVKTTSV